MRRRAERSDRLRRRRLDDDRVRVSQRARTGVAGEKHVWRNPCLLMKPKFE